MAALEDSSPPKVTFKKLRLTRLFRVCNSFLLIRSCVGVNLRNNDISDRLLELQYQDYLNTTCFSFIFTDNFFVNVVNSS